MCKKKGEYRKYQHSQEKSLGESKVVSCMVVLGFSLNLSSCLEVGDALRLKDVHSPDNVLTADGTLAHSLAALGAGHHVTAL